MAGEWPAAKRNDNESFAKFCESETMLATGSLPPSFLPPSSSKLDGAHLIENNLLENIRKQEIFALFPGTTPPCHPAQPRLPQHATESFVVFGLGIW